jgi:predicted adenylyl cyclase CyaB
MVWLEVETKVHVENPNKLRKKIESIANFVKKETRSDDYFALRRKFRRHGYPKKAFRIRKKSNKYEINFKIWLKKYWDKQIVVKQEFEFGLKNRENLGSLLALFKDLGFEQWVQKRKTCESYVHKKDKRIIIEINKVEHLGYFMEIEYLAKFSEINKAKEKIRQTLMELEINQEDIDNTGYTKMLWKKGIKDKKNWGFK